MKEMNEAKLGWDRLVTSVNKKEMNEVCLWDKQQLLSLSA